MGISKHTYLGPHCKTPKNPREEDVPVRGCSKCVQRIWDPNCKFCPTCGAPIDSFKIKETRSTDPWPVQEQMRERLCHISDMGGFNKELEFWIPNVKFLERKVHLEHGEGYSLVIRHEVIASELNIFDQTFEKEITMLFEAYGVVQTDWGLLMWQS